MAALDFPASPTTGQTFTGPNGAVWSWDGTKWISATSGNLYSAINNVGRNLIHNPLFAVQQRGIGPWTLNNSYTADRWVMSFAGGSLSTSIGTVNDTNRAQIGDEAAAFHFVADAAGGAGTNDETYFEQRIEGVRRTAGKTVTLSFWAAATAGTPKLSVPMIQIFGTGGSPASVAVPAPQIITLSTTYTRYTLTYTVPTIAGKTLGTAGTDYLSVRFGLSAGAGQAALYGALGQQSYVLALWGVQLEVGTAATPLEKLDPMTQLQQCQRFYYASALFGGGYQAAGQNITSYLVHPVQMRGQPLITIGGSPTLTNATGLTTSANPGAVAWWFTNVATGTGAVSATFIASADL